MHRGNLQTKGHDEIMRPLGEKPSGGSDEMSYRDGQMRPGSTLAQKKKRGKRISRGKNANDAAMAISEHLKKGKGY